MVLKSYKGDFLDLLLVMIFSLNTQVLQKIVIIKIFFHNFRNLVQFSSVRAVCLKEFKQKSHLKNVHHQELSLPRLSEISEKNWST